LFNYDTPFSPPTFSTPLGFDPSYTDDPPELGIDHALSTIFANQHEQSRQILRFSQTEDLQNLLGARSHLLFQPPFADETVFGYFSTEPVRDREAQPFLDYADVFGMPSRLQSRTPTPFIHDNQDTDFVDITSPSPSPPRRHSTMDSQPQRGQKRTQSQITSNTTTAEPSQKRRRSSNSRPTSRHGESSQTSHRTRRNSRPNATAEPITIDTIDLSAATATAPLANTLRKQREEAVLAQQPAAHQSNGDDKPLRLGTLSCIICMDRVTDITTTKCGHFFCHTCLMEALIAGENREGGRSQCPVCRTAVKRGKKDEVVPLLLMKGGPRRSAGLGKAKERAKV